MEDHCGKTKNKIPNMWYYINIKKQSTEHERQNLNMVQPNLTLSTDENKSTMTMEITRTTVHNTESNMLNSSS